MQPSAAQCSPIMPNTAHCSPIQPSTAQHSLIRPRTAQYSQVQLSTAQLKPSTFRYSLPSLLTSSHLLPYLPFQKLHSLLCLVAKKFYLCRRRRIGGVEEKKERKHLKQASTSGVGFCFCLFCCFCFLVSWFSGFGSHYQIVLIVKKTLLVVNCINYMLAYPSFRSNSSTF